MPRRLANNGYLAIGKETTKGVAVIPSIFIPLYDETMMTKINVDDDSPIVGLKAKNFQQLQGMRSHGGDFTILAEPNTAAHIINMLYTKGTTTGAGPFTHPFTLSTTQDPKSYTIEILKGLSAWRFAGCEASVLDILFNKNKMQFKVKTSALNSFIVREIQSLSVATVTLKTNYSLIPTTGLVAGDLVGVISATTGAIQNLTVLSVTATTVTFTATPTSISAGDTLILRGQTPSLATLSPFLWTNTQFCIGPDAATALSGAQTRAEVGTKYSLIHEFESDNGDDASGDFDPVILNRRLGDANADLKLFFDTLDDMNKYLTSQKKALVARHFVNIGNGNIYEMRVTLNNLHFIDDPVNLKSDSILYSEGKLKAYYDQTDAQVFDVKVINNLATI